MQVTDLQMVYSEKVCAHARIGLAMKLKVAKCIIVSFQPYVQFDLMGSGIVQATSGIDMLPDPS